AVNQVYEVCSSDGMVLSKETILDVLNKQLLTIKKLKAEIAWRESNAIYESGRISEGSETKQVKSCMRCRLEDETEQLKVNYTAEDYISTVKLAHDRELQIDRLKAKIKQLKSYLTCSLNDGVRAKEQVREQESEIDQLKNKIRQLSLIVKAGKEPVVTYQDDICATVTKLAKENERLNDEVMQLKSYLTCARDDWSAAKTLAKEGKSKV
ncbi:unnamed protein product, partial [marine sediment metagenome]